MRARRGIVPVPRNGQAGMPILHYRAVGSVNYLCVPFAKHSEQPASVVQCVNGVSLIRRFDGIFKPIGDAWVFKDLFGSHTQ